MPRLLHITDLHIKPEPHEYLAGILPDINLKAVLDDAFDRYARFDLIVISGDLTQDPTVGSYARIRQMLMPFKTPVLSVPGNHDDLTLMQHVLNSEAFSCAAVTRLQNWQIISINSQQPDSTQGMVSQAALTQLKQALHSPLPSVVVMHHHCLDTGSPWMDRMKISNAEELLTVFADHSHLKLVLHGHVHQALKWRYQQLDILATPSTAVQFAPLASAFEVTADAPGYRVIELQKNGDYRCHTHSLSHPPQRANLISSRY